MSNLIYETRGNANPQGKPRVYFCAHSQDMARCYAELSRDILLAQNCSIWRQAENTPCDRLFWEDLAGMQLFVMPVTTRLLTTENSALEEEFPFAIAHHIPVLPIMMEAGLAELFNRKCGELQYLEKYSTDTTAIGYTEKLKKYLSSVLVGDEMAAKIRAAFDAYVFLSYRKKDRAYARELMHLIHKNDFCRDIAIWYDEFLTPGENFNSSIRAALEQSDLFVLNVTPNLTNEENYIMTVEYPMAKKQVKKRILPLEMVPTDPVALAEKYEAIPPCVDARQEEDLARALADALSHVAMRANDADPAHNFFIGLAYLGGVDVEVDHARAVELIAASANAGLPEAMEKMVAMYENGEGVARDYAQVLVWKRRIAAQKEAQYTAEPTETHLEEYAYSLCSLNSSLYEGRRLDEEETTAKTLQALLAQGMAQFPASEKLLRYRMTCESELGDIYKERGEMGLAKEQYEAMLAFRGQLVETADTDTSLAGGYSKLGDICVALGQMEDAHRYYTQALAESEKLLAKSDTPAARRALAVVFSDLGDFYEHQSQINRSIEYHQRAKELFAGVLAETQTVAATVDVAVSFNRLGRMEKAKGNFAGAKNHYLSALDVYRKLAEVEQTLATENGLSGTLQYLGDLYFDGGDLQNGKRYYRESLAICEEVAKKVDTVSAHTAIATLSERLGDICTDTMCYDEALTYYQRAVEVNEPLIPLGLTDTRKGLGATYQKIGDVYFYGKRDYDMALAYYEKDFAITSELCKQVDLPEVRLGLSFCYEKQGDVHHAKGAYKKARACYEQMFALSTDLMHTQGTIQMRINMTQAHFKMGQICEAETSFADARDHYRAMLTLCERLQNEVAMTYVLRQLALCLGALGRVAVAMDDLENALSYCERAVAVRSRISKHTGMEGDLHNERLDRQKLEQVRKQLQKHAPSTPSKVQAATTASATTTPPPPPPQLSPQERQRRAAKDCTRLAAELAAKGTAETALVYYKKAIAILQRMVTMTHQREDILALADCCKHAAELSVGQARENLLAEARRLLAELDI